MKMNSNNHALCTGILSTIYHLRKDLKKLEENEPQLFDGDDPAIRCCWEFWSTDDILEIISDEIKGLLLKNNIPTHLVGNSDELTKEVTE